MWFRGFRLRRDYRLARLGDIAAACRAAAPPTCRRSPRVSALLQHTGTLDC